MQAKLNRIVGLVFAGLLAGGCVHFQAVDAKTGTALQGVHVERLRQYVWEDPSVTLPIALVSTNAKGQTASSVETRLFSYLFTFSKPGYVKMNVWIAKDDNEARVFPAARSEVANPDLYPIRIPTSQLICVPMVPKPPAPDCCTGTAAAASTPPSPQL